MMRKIIGNSIGHKLNTSKFPKPSDFVCTTCVTGKLILRPSYLKIKAEPLQFLERIQRDICGPIIHQPDHLGTSWYLFMHLLDGPMYVYYLQETMLLQGSLLKLSN
jgi:hypothetical protein